MRHLVLVDDAPPATWGSTTWQAFESMLTQMMAQEVEANDVHGSCPSPPAQWRAEYLLVAVMHVGLDLVSPECREAINLDKFLASDMLWFMPLQLPLMVPSQQLATALTLATTLTPGDSENSDFAAYKGLSRLLTMALFAAHGDGEPRNVRRIIEAIAVPVRKRIGGQLGHATDALRAVRIVCPALLDTPSQVSGDAAVNEGTLFADALPFFGGYVQVTSAPPPSPSATPRPSPPPTRASPI